MDPSSPLGGTAAHSRPAAIRRTSLLLNGATSGFMLENSPAGFGYQAQRCMVIRTGCQNVNLAPDAAFFAHVLEFLSGMKVPSA